MFRRDAELGRGLTALRLALKDVLDPVSVVAGAVAGVVAGAVVPGAPIGATVGAVAGPALAGGWFLSEAVDYGGSGSDPDQDPGRSSATVPDSNQACSSEADEAEAGRLIALVDQARNGDCDAFGMLYDHYHASVYRFLYYRVGSVPLAEDLMSETFFRALRSMGSFRWQGKDFGAWLMTIARNLTADHFKSGRTRLEHVTEDMSPHDEPTEGPESAVLASLTNESLLRALAELPAEQQEWPGRAFSAGPVDRGDGKGARPQQRCRQAAAAARGAQPRQAVS